MEDVRKSLRAVGQRREDSKKCVDHLEWIRKHGTSTKLTLLVLGGNFRSGDATTGCHSECLTPAFTLVLGILDNIQHHFIAISTLDASLPALEGLITLAHDVPLSKRSARGSLAISDAIFYSYANSMIMRTR